MHIDDFPKYIYNYSFNISDITTSVDAILKAINKHNKWYRKHYAPSYKGNIIHYHMIRNKEKQPVSMTLKLVGLCSEGKTLLHDILYKNVTDSAVVITINDKK